MAKRYTPTSLAADVEAARRLLDGRWKLVILFHLFGGKVMPPDPMGPIPLFCA
jgi:DNA-binding HxlR family transcriptional regulator